MSAPIKKVLVVGSGPIIIGQAAEFDYAGTQACKALREEGVKTILVNSNPATIMTDEGIADVVYIEPLTVEVLARIIEAERPDGILPTLGGQTGLNLTMELSDAGVLDQYGVRLLGTQLEAIRKAEDRELFKELLLDIKQPVLPSETVSSKKDALLIAKRLGLPLVVRPAYTLGGTGGGIATTYAELAEIVLAGLAASPINQVLLERSLVGWKEIEYEVMRDGDDNCITVCNMENLDPMGVHTGDSIVVAPSQTLTDKDYQMLRSASLDIIRALQIEGGCNVQFALEPSEVVSKTLPVAKMSASPYYVIEVNPRVSRSSALASKATGYPIARVAAKIAVGKRLDEILNAVTQKTIAAFEPALDYCVVKIPRWPFDKFPSGERNLGTQMKATGEVMAIDRSFPAAFQKAMRSLEITNRSLLWEDKGVSFSAEPSTKPIIAPTDERVWSLLSALRSGMDADDLARATGIDPWFTHSLAQIIFMEKRLLVERLDQQLLWEAKRLGFSDATISELTNQTPEQVRILRIQWGLKPVYKMVDTCAAEFEAQTPYFYSTYEQENEGTAICGSKAVVIGSGPIRIGQGIEFDYCSVHAAWALQQQGVKSIMINSNPETVSTDFDTTDRLYFEPLDEESVRDILDNEVEILDSEHKSLPSSIVQFGGQTAINLSQTLDQVKLPIMGSTAESIDKASDRHLFESFLDTIEIPKPPGAAVKDLEQALNVADGVGYPILVRPSYVLGGRAMEIVQNAKELTRYMNAAIAASSGRRILIDKYLEGLEIEVDAVCDGENVLIPGIMEHVERAGVHSGDSMAIYPSLTLNNDEIRTIVDYTTKIGLGLQVRGLMNIQYVVVRDRNYGSRSEEAVRRKAEVYVIEVNPRASRTIPFISKMTDIPMVRLSIGVMLGKTLNQQGYQGGLCKNRNLIGVKAPVFSMAKLAGVDTYLGPEMKSTGEVMGVDYSFSGAVSKALMASGLMLPPKGSVLLSVADHHKAEAIPIFKNLSKAGYTLYATDGTAETIRGLGLDVITTPKLLNEDHPNVLDVIMNGTVNAVINTVSGDRAVLQDGYRIRRAAVDMRIPCFTSLDTARAVVESLCSDPHDYNVKPLRTYLSGE